jgi:hypothetical protein
MEYMELNSGKVKISAMGIADFLVGVTSKIKEGYELNYEDNDMYPVAYGGFFEVILRKSEVEEKGAEEKGESKRGRKPKGEQD